MGLTGLPSFEVARRVRPVAIVAACASPTRLTVHGAPGEFPCPRPAPSAAVVAELAATPERGDEARIAWVSGGDVLEARYDGRRVSLEVTAAGGAHRAHRSRRFGRVSGATALAVTVTGTTVTAFTRDGDGRWTARARAVSGTIPVHDEAWCAALRVRHSGPVERLTTGGFGQLGLRDIRVVTNLDGSAYSPDGRILLTATSAGPGFFGTAHASVWELHPDTGELTHCSDLFFRRPDRSGVFGDHAIHLVRLPPGLRDGPGRPSSTTGGWLAAVSTWGDFDRNRPGARVGATLARSTADLLTGEHVLDTVPLSLPTDGLQSVGVWDPHLVRRDGEWVAGYVSARKYFDFHPVVATGPSLDELTLRAAATDRVATEGTTLLPRGDRLLVLASDGRDNPARHRAEYPVFDESLRQLGTLDAHYPTNLPWPTLIEREEGTLLVGFNGAAYGGKLLGYGTHGDVVIARERSAGPSTAHSRAAGPA